MNNDLRTIEERGIKPHAGMKGETECPGCHKTCPAEWKQWSREALLFTFQCVCGDHIDFEDEIEEDAA